MVRNMSWRRRIELWLLCRISRSTESCCRLRHIAWLMGGCILAGEKVDTHSVLSSGFRLNVVFEKTLQDEKLLLLRKVIVILNSFTRNW